MNAIPLPPPELIARVGWLAQGDDPVSVYERRGREHWDYVKDLLPDGWALEGRRILDFGCGAGRMIRHALPEAASNEIWGCDIDARSIAWLEENLSPPLHVFRNDELPPLPQPDGHFDLITALSVFTHLTDSWSTWLLELHRVLADDGLLIATVGGPGRTELIPGEPFDEDRVGMNVIMEGTDWDEGGPRVMHSTWWIKAHWGRAFDILELRTDHPIEHNFLSHSAVVMRKRPVDVTREELERPEPDEARELAAARHNLEQVQRELIELRGSSEDALGRERRRTAQLEQAVRTLSEQVGRLEESKSYRLTSPLRSAAGALRRLRRPTTPSSR